ncbi:MAG: hypothetical protein ACREJD_05835 [Phycisphaerales bacterium]
MNGQGVPGVGSNYAYVLDFDNIPAAAGAVPGSQEKQITIDDKNFEMISRMFHAELLADNANVGRAGTVLPRDSVLNTAAAAIATELPTLNNVALEFKMNGTGQWQNSPMRANHCTGDATRPPLMIPRVMLPARSTIQVKAYNYTAYALKAQLVCEGVRR